MSDPSTIERPPRQLSQITVGVHLLGIDLQRQLRSRKTLVLALVQSLPLVIALLTLYWSRPDGLEAFQSTVEGVYLPLLMPLAALFFGGSTVVDEVEDRTITYLTLRPLSRVSLFLAKLATSVILAISVTVIPIVLYFLLCVLASPDGFGDGMSLLGAALGSVAMGALTYTTIFALLGVVFTSTLLPGVVYYVVFELILAAIPVVEILSVKFHLFAMGGLQRRDPNDEEGIREMLERFLLDQPLEPQWWVSLLCLAAISAAAITAGALLFRQRQFHV